MCAHSVTVLCIKQYSKASVAEPVHFSPAPARLRPGSGSNFYKKKSRLSTFTNIFEQRSFFLTIKISFIYKYLFFSIAFYQCGN